MHAVKIKAGKITNLSDARYFSAMGVEMLGFCLDPTVDEHLTLQTFAPIRGWVEGPVMIAELGFMEPEQLLSTTALIQVDGVQLSMFSQVPDAIYDSEMRVIREIPVENRDDKQSLTKKLSACQHEEEVLMDCMAGNLSWPVLQGNSALLAGIVAGCQRYNTILRMDFQPSQLPEILATLPLYGIELLGGAEEKVGFKSYEDLDAVFELLGQ